MGHLRHICTQRVWFFLSLSHFHFLLCQNHLYQEAPPSPYSEALFSLLNVGAHWLQVLINVSLQPCSSNPWWIKNLNHGVKHLKQTSIWAYIPSSAGSQKSLSGDFFLLRLAIEFMKDSRTDWHEANWAWSQDCPKCVSSRGQSGCNSVSCWNSRPFLKSRSPRVTEACFLPEKKIPRGK